MENFEEVVDAQDELDVEAGEEVNDTVVESSKYDDTRERAIYAEREARFLREQLDAMNRKFEALQQPQDSYHDDDVPSVKDVKSMVDKQLASLKKESAEKIRKEQFQTAKEKYSDFDTVIKLADSIINPQMFDVIMASDNPAEMAYRIGLTHPSYQKQQQTNKAEKIAKNMTSPKGVSDMAGKSTEGKKSYSTMPYEEFLREKSALLYG